jgi:ubiquinone/menaquinone biosynthesis C-methylase UbiE
MRDADQVEAAQKEKFRRYYPDRIVDRAPPPANDYFAHQSAIRNQLVRESYHSGTIVDLCSGDGLYLVPAGAYAEHIVGVDFSPEMLAIARERADRSGLRNASYCVGNAREVPLRSGTVSLIFSFSALYCIPRVDEVVHECARILEPGGRAILDFGIYHSLNTLVAGAYPELAAPCHIPLARMFRYLREAGLQVERDLGFQLLPLWGGRPAWLRPLLHPYWKRLMALDVRGRMLDQWLSEAPVLRNFAFRHIIVCRRPAR